MAPLEILLHQGANVAVGVAECSKSSTTSTRIPLIDSHHDGKSVPTRTAPAGRDGSHVRSSSSGGCSRSPNLKRRVSFNRMVKMRAALHRNDYKEEELRAVWYTEEEKTMTLLEAKRIVNQLNAGGAMSQEDMLGALGLECRTRFESLKKAEVRSLSRTLLRDEQQRQWESRVHDPEGLAMVCFTISNQAQMEATQRGRLDELTALQI